MSIATEITRLQTANADEWREITEEEYNEINETNFN